MDEERLNENNVPEEEILLTEGELLEEEDIAEEEEEESSVDSLDTIGGFFAFLGRTTVQFFKNLPDAIRNRVKAKIAEHRRMPKRKSISKVYVLVGYTTKEYVDRKYRKERALLVIRKILIACIIFLVLVMTYRWFKPKVDYTEYKQMIGVNELDELTQSDPFATETTNNAIAPDVQNVTPIPSNTSTSETSATQPAT